MGMKLSMCVSVRADLEVMQQRQAVLGGSEFLINLDLLQRTPEFHQLHQSCTVQSFRNPQALSKTPHPFELCVIPLKQRSHEYKQHSAFSYGHK